MRPGDSGAAGGRMTIRNLTAGEVVFNAGDIGTEAFFVLSGALCVAHEHTVIATLGPGEIVGEMALIEASTRSANVYAGASGARVACVNAAQLVFLITNQPAFALAIVETLSKRLRNAIGAAPMPAPELPARAAPPWDIGSSLRDLGNGVLQIQGYGHSANCYVLRGSRRTVLIDTCLPANAEKLELQLAKANIKPSDIDTIVLTHEHADHVGGLFLFPKATIQAHRLAANKLRMQDDLSMMARSFNTHIDPYHVDVWLAEGSIVDTGSHRLAVHYTPGHTSGHISLFDARLGLLFSGDCVMAGGHIGGIFGSGNIADYLQTLELLAGLDAKIMLPGHGTISDNPKQDIELAQQRCERLFQDMNEITQAPANLQSYQRLISNARDLNRFYRNS